MSDVANKLVFIDAVYQESRSSISDFSSCFSYQDGVLDLRFPKNFHRERAIFLEHVCETAGDNRLVQTISVAENSELTLVDVYRGKEDIAYHHEIETRLELAPNARVHYYKWQYESEQGVHKATLSATLSQHSYLGTYHVLLGSRESNDKFVYSLQGEGSTCESIGFYQSKDQQLFQVDSRIHHLSSNTNSRQLYKGIADDQSHAIFNGMVMVDPNISEICAHQKNDNLLLSAQAQVDTKPELEIYSEDVRCSHGATVGQLDEDALFYLRSRGVDQQTAARLLTDGFANEIFNAFPHEEIVQAMRKE